MWPWNSFVVNVEVAGSAVVGDGVDAADGEVRVGLNGS